MNYQLKIIVLAFGTVLLAACSTAPKRAVRVPDPVVKPSDAASAIIAADAVISTAKQRKSLWRDTEKMFIKADKAMDAGEYKKARDLAKKAGAQAEAALIQSYRGDALFIITTLRKDYMDQMNLEQKTRLDSAASALATGQEKDAYDIASGIMADLTAPMAVAEATKAPVVEVKSAPAPAPAPALAPESAPVLKSGATSYTVKPNDNLWNIAAKPEIYGNVDMWPLLWKANKEKIKQPDDIEKGMKLVINRSASKESVTAAIKYSKLRGATSLGPADVFDQQFISR